MFDLPSLDPISVPNCDLELGFCDLDRRVSPDVVWCAMLCSDIPVNMAGAKKI